MHGPSALACPASLKGVLPAREAAAALEDGFAEVGVGCIPLAIADGGEGTVEALSYDLTAVAVRDAFGRPREALVGLRGDARIVEAAQVIPLDPLRLDVMSASSRGLGELLSTLRADRLVISAGGTATMDAGVGLLEALAALPAPTTVLCDVQTKLYDAPRLFGPQKGASPEQIAMLETRFRALTELEPYAEVPGSGAAGGLGAALAALGAELVAGAPAVLDLIGFNARGHALVVTGEGTVDATTAEGKAPAEVARRAAEAGVPCIVFGGVVTEPLAAASETIALSGVPERARDDLVDLGRRLGTRLLDAAR